MGRCLCGSSDPTPVGSELPMWCRMWKLASGSRRRGGGPCVYVPERVANRPDPCLYSQFMLMSLGQPVTWDNPDVTLRRGGIEQFTYDLTVATEYEVEVTVHNASRRKPALSTEVRLGWIEFGAGADARHPIGSQWVDVGVWPATSSTTFAWTTPATPGHYCLEVELFHVDDGNPSNNRGWNNTVVHEAHSEVRAPIRVFNQWVHGCAEVEERRPDLIELPLLLGFVLLGIVFGAMGAAAHRAIAHAGDHADVEIGRVLMWAAIGALGGAVVGSVRGMIAAARRQRRDVRDPDRDRQRDRRQRERTPCELVEIAVDSYRFEDGKGKDVDPASMFAPRPPAWPARVEPATFRFDPGELHRDVVLVVDAPDGPGDPAPFNVSVRQGGAPTGGVTVLVERGV